MKLSKCFSINSSVKFALLILIICLLITYQVFNAVKIDEAQKKQAYFDFRVREAIDLINHRMQTYEQILRGVAGLFKASNNIERNEFKRYMAMLDLTNNFSGMQGVGFSLIVPASKKTQHIASIHSEGFPEYTIRPDGQRDIYTSIVYLEPFSDRNLRAFGYDMFTDPVRHAAMQKWVDSGHAALSGKVKLVQETGKQEQAGFLMYLPIYRNATNNDTVSERRAHILGWVYAPFRIGDLMKGLFGEHAKDLDIQIFDGESISNDALMYHSEGSSLVNAELGKTLHMQIAGHTWTIHISPLPIISSRVQANHPESVAAIGIIISVLLSLFSWVLLTINNEKEKRADELVIANKELSIAAIAFESQEGMVVTDANNVILRVNSAFTNITGYEAKEAINQTPRLLSSGKHDKAFFIDMWQSINNTGAWDGEIWNKRKSGEIYPEYLTITAVKDTVNIVTNYVATHIDITMRHAAADKIENLAFYDPLTHLPNRRLLLDRLNQAVATSARTVNRGALLFINLDHFKKLNDTLGHVAGDLLLEQVAARLTACIREGYTVARLGGDEFVVLLEILSAKAIEAAAQAKTVAVKILSSLNQPYQLNTQTYHNTASIGATLFNGHEQAPEELLKQADIAMYHSKTDGRNTLRFFDPRMQETINVRADMENELRKAIEQFQFQLYYQIQVGSSGQVLGAEALIRWNHPERGIISPFNFIPLAEDTGLILPIGMWVLDTACAQLNTWQQSTLTQDLVLAVNVSAKQFFQVNFVEQVKATLLRHEINPARLKLELTESMLVENINDIIIKMNALSKIGIRFSLDDFGTGYSSLQYLKKLPLNQLKIDQSFVRDIAIDSSDRAIVRTIITMANSLDINVIAESVETAEQQQFLLDNGCMHYQGYLFSKPVPIGEFEALLSKT